MPTCVWWRNEVIWYDKKMFIIKTAQFLRLINMNDTQVITL